RARRRREAGVHRGERHSLPAVMGGAGDGPRSAGQGPPVGLLLMAKRKRNRNPVAPRSSPPVLPGLIGPSRTVPRDIGRPPYAASGDPGRGRPDPVRTPDVIERMRRAGAAAADILLHVGPFVEPGVTTDRL